MGNIIKLNTVFTDPVNANPFGQVPSIAQLNQAIYTVGNNVGDLVNASGFVRLSNMTEASLVSKGAFYIHGYGVYNGSITDAPSHSNFVEYVYLDGGGTSTYQNREMIASAPKVNSLRFFISVTFGTS